MPETFCGKNCENCEQKQELNCQGCKQPWGKPANEDCEIAVCCCGKGHETCETCAFRNNCGKVRGREDMLYYRRRKREEEERRRDAWRERAELMGKWCTALFWIVIGAEIAALLGDTMLGNSLAVIFGVAYGAALLQLAPLTQQYRTAGICALAAAVVVLIMGAIPVNSDAAVWTILLLIPGSVVSLVGDYHELHAHAEMLEGMDDEFSKKWKKLWKWQIRLLLLVAGLGWLVIVSPVLILSVMMIGVLGVHIAKIIYLYRMAKFFRNYEL